MVSANYQQIIAQAPMRANTPQGAWGRVAKFVGFGRRGENEDDNEYLERFGIPAKLMAAVQKNYDDMEPIRIRATQAIREFIGFYVEGNEFGAPREVILNKIRQAVSIYMRFLASGIPQGDVQTEYDDLKAFAYSFKLNLNRQLATGNLSAAQRQAVLSAMFSYGVLKTGLAEGDAEDHFLINGALHDLGKTFTRSVTPDNFVIDMEAESLDEIDFIGDRFQRPAAWVEAMRGGQGGNAGPETRTTSRMPPENRAMGERENAGRRLYKKVWLWEIYLPKQNLICLFVDGEQIPLQVYPWNGPKGGPYKIIGFHWVPGEVLPVAPAAALLPLHNFINSLLRKLERQADRQKTLGLYEKGRGDTDAAEIKKANDGDMVGLVLPLSLKETNFGGPNPLNHNMAMFGISSFDSDAGGLQVLGGTAAVSDTARQELLIHKTANTLIESMQSEIREKMSQVFKQWAWYIWTDPLRTYTATHDVGGGYGSIPITLSPEVRQGNFLDYNFTFSFYSLMEKTPTEQAQQEEGLWNRVIGPNTQLLMQQGTAPNAAEYVKRIYELYGANSDGLLTPMNGRPMETQGKKGQAPWPADFGAQAAPPARPVASPRGTAPPGQFDEMMQSNSRMATSNAAV